LEEALNSVKMTELYFESLIQMFLSLFSLIGDLFLNLSNETVAGSNLKLRTISLFISLVALSIGFSKDFLGLAVNSKFIFYPDIWLLISKFLGNFSCLTTRAVLIVVLYQIIPLGFFILIIIYLYFTIFFLYLKDKIVQLKKGAKEIEKASKKILYFTVNILVYIPICFIFKLVIYQSFGSKFCLKTIIFHSTFFSDMIFLNFIFWLYFPYYNDKTELPFFIYYYLNIILTIFAFFIEVLINSRVHKLKQKNNVPNEY
jgi:hypothetical protein